MPIELNKLKYYGFRLKVYDENIIANNFIIIDLNEFRIYVHNTKMLRFEVSTDITLKHLNVIFEIEYSKKKIEYMKSVDRLFTHNKVYYKSVSKILEQKKQEYINYKNLMNL